jgi:hypothetical protein
MNINPTLSVRRQPRPLVAILCLTLLAVALVFSLRASNQTALSLPAISADALLGQQQVERLWAAFAKPDLAALDQFVAPGFQSLHEDGARDWPQERLLIAELKLTPYMLFDYKVTRHGDVLLVTYQCKVGETLGDARLAKVSTPRLDVFQLMAGEWRLLSHVNVRRMLPTIPPDSNPMMIAGTHE